MGGSAVSPGNRMLIFHILAAFWKISTYVQTYRNGSFCRFRLGSSYGRNLFQQSEKEKERLFVLCYIMQMAMCTWVQTSTRLFMCLNISTRKISGIPRSGFVLLQGLLGPLTVGGTGHLVAAWSSSLWVALCHCKGNSAVAQSCS